MKILLIDAFSAQHIGNAALLDSALEQIKAQFPEAEFTILAFDPASIADLSGSKTLATLWAEPFSGYPKIKQLGWVIREGAWLLINTLNFSVLRRIGLSVDTSVYTSSPEKIAAVEAYSEADIVVSISGEALQDAFWKRVPLFLYGYWLAHVMDKIVAIFPQSIGPLEKSFTRTIARFVLNRCDLVFPRDHLSLETVKSLKISSAKVHLVPDVAVNQSYVSSNRAKQLLTEESVDLNRRPVVGVAVSRWKGLDIENYFPVMQDLCEFISTDLNGSVVLFSPNMPFRDESSDWELAQELYEKIPNKEYVVLLSRTYTPREFKGMQGELDLFISTRMHAAILSTMIGTPTITINTQPKLLGYMTLIGQENRACKIEDFTVERAKKLIKETLANGDQIRAELEGISDEIGKRSRVASELLREAYNRKVQTEQ